jgi:TPR repeat protein
MLAAAEWCREAANQGQADAQYYLGALYAQRFDFGVVQSFVESHRWYQMAADQGRDGAATAATWAAHAAEVDAEVAAAWAADAAARAAASDGAAEEYEVGEMAAWVWDPPSMVWWLPDHHARAQLPKPWADCCCSRCLFGLVTR